MSYEDWGVGMDKGDKECVTCLKNQFPKHRAIIGVPEIVDQGKSRTTFTRYCCRVCGATWLCTEDEGLGGHGKYYSKESK